MRILSASALLLAAMIGLATTGAPAAAQGSKTKKAAAGSGAIEIKKGNDDKFRFSVRDADGKYLVGSSAMKTEDDAKAAVASFKTVLTKAKVVMATKEKGKAVKGGAIEVAKGKDDKYHFNVRDGEGKFLAGSRPVAYESEKAVNSAISTLKDVVAAAKMTMGAAKEEKKKGSK